MGPRDGGVVGAEGQATLCTHTVRTSVGASPIDTGASKNDQSMTRASEVRLRRVAGFLAIGSLLLLDLVATGLFGGSERFLAVVRSVVLPGLPFLEWNVLIGIFTISLALVAVGAWLRFGADWMPILAMACSVGVAAWVMPLHHDAPPDSRPDSHTHHQAVSIAGPAQSQRIPPVSTLAPLEWVAASHEFTVLLVIFALIARLRLLLTRLPVTSRMLSDRGTSEVNVARMWTLALLSGQAEDSDAEPRLLKRARRVNRIARLRFSGDPLQGSHAVLRAALSLSGRLDEKQANAFCASARASLAGVPDSEPTWIRPLDAMLAAMSLQRCGAHDAVEHWRLTFAECFRLRHGRRPAALHRPSMLAMGTLTDWEHAMVTALAYELGWIDSSDWAVLRRRCLGAAARGATEPDALRLIAAGQWWARKLGDSEAAEILLKRTLDADRMAVVIARFSVGAVSDREC